jgi:hypothetical protein
MLNNLNDMTNVARVRKLALLFIVLGLFLVSCVGLSFPSSSYAKSTIIGQEQQQSVRALDVSMHIENKVVPQGNTQAIDFQVNDQKSRQPIGGSIISATVIYADGQTIRQFNGLSDEFGQCNISWRIERNAPVGNYRVSYSVSQTGYISGSIVPELYFTVIPPSNSIQEESAKILSLWHIN